VRSLVAAGHDVWTIGASKRTLAGVSRGVRSAVVTASALDAPLAYAEAVARLTRSLGIDVLLPVSDAAVEALLRHRDLLPEDVALPLPPLATFRTGTDKIRMLELARRAGFAVPASEVIASMEDAEEAIASAVFPAIVKPHRSVVTAAGGHCHKLDVEFVADSAACRAALRALPPEAFPLLLQQRIRGRGEGLFSLRWQGATVATFAHRRLREKPPAGGLSVYRESIAATDALVAATDALLASLDWQGVAMVECKVDRETGRHVFMELNGRLWGSLQLAIDAGVDFPALLVACATGAPVTAHPGYETGVRSRWFWGDMDHLYARLTKSPERLHLEAPYPSRLRVVGDVLRAPFIRRDRAEIGRWSDPMPALLEAARRLTPSFPRAVLQRARALMPARRGATAGTRPASALPVGRHGLKT
jgi:predicted ATP-grasp superfamily ATP-dependent carboligase